MLTARQTRFALEYALDHNGAAAAARSGYSAKSARDIACRLLRNPEIKERIDRAAEDLAAKLEIRRESVLEGLLEGVALARAKGDPGSLISAWKEIARLLGFYPPKESRVRVSADRVRRDRAIEALTDGELEALLARQIAGTSGGGRVNLGTAQALDA